MFTLVGIFVLLSVAAARPGILQTQTSLETIGSIVNHIPTAITHQSKTEIHNQQPVISQIIAPALRTIPVQTILQANPIIASQIQSPVLLDQNQQQQILSGQVSQVVIGEEQGAALSDQREILQDQTSLIGGQRIVVGDNRELTESGVSIASDQNIILKNVGPLSGTINASELELKSNIKALGR